MLNFSSDEISALVLDPGWMNVRAGFAGEDVPKSVVPSHYGDLSKKDIQKLVFGDNAIHTPTPGMEIRNPIGKDGTVEDWDTAAKVWEYAITSRLTNFKPSAPINHDEKTDRPMIMEVEMEGVGDNEKPLEENPLLMTETAWNPIKSRERAIEVAMESWGCPAFWLARNSVLAAFAAGKASALVVDVGATSISVTPIHDGLILKKGIQRSPLGGNWLSSQLRTLFNNSDPKVDLTPHFMIASKTPVDAGAPAQATYRTFDTPPTASYEHYKRSVSLPSSKNQSFKSGRDRVASAQEQRLVQQMKTLPSLSPGVFLRCQMEPIKCGESTASKLLRACGMRRLRCPCHGKQHQLKHRLYQRWSKRRLDP